MKSYFFLKTKNNLDIKRNIGAFVLLLTLIVIGNKAWGQQNVAVRNNLMYDISLTPNVGFDVRIAPKWTLGMNAGYRPWPTDDSKTRKWKHILIAPELRHWNDSIFHRTYWGLNLIYSHYNVGGVKFPFGVYSAVRDHRLQGDLLAVGAFYGRSWRLNRFFRLEAELGMGIGYTWAEKYNCPHCGSYVGRDDKVFLVPKLALNIVYQKIKKKPMTPPVTTIEVVPPPPPPVELKFHPVADNTGKAGALQQDNPVLAHISQYRPYDRTRILRKEKGALYVHFPVAKDELTRDFRNNAEVLDRIVEITRQVMADTTSSVCRIQIVGLASIEGAVDNNERLAAQRGEALKRYIQQQVPKATDDLFDVANGGEAWAELRDQINDVVTEMTTSGVEADGGRKAGLKAAIDLIDSEANLTRREQLLRQQEGGRTFNYIKEHLLADQRNSGYIRIYYDYVPDTAAATINQASELLQQERYDEALQLLQGVKSDPRAQNALGVALWHTGEKAEALECFSRAADDGNADAKENLRQLLRQMER